MEENRSAATVSSARREEIRQGIFNSLSEVPPVAPVALKVMRMVDDLNTSAADLARVISRDQGLTSKLMHSCNSAFYGLVSPVSTLSQAVVVLGLRTVRNLVLVHSLPVGRSGGGRMSDVSQQLWGHSVGCALGCRLLAMELGGMDPETAFLGGLFHDLGRSLIHRVQPRVYEALCHASEPGMPAPEMERQVLGTDHPEVGGHALEGMQIAPELVETVRRHHGPLEGLPRPALFVRAAEEMLHEEADGSWTGGEAVAALQIGSEALARMRERLTANLQQELSSFQAAA